MTAFQASIQAAFAFAETLPSAGTVLRPAANRTHLLAARDGVFFHAVIGAIVDARAESATAEDFIIATDNSVNAEIAYRLYGAEAAATDAARAAARAAIKQYCSAENFARHAIAC